MRFFQVHFLSSCSCCRNDPKAFHDSHFRRGDKHTIAEQKPMQNGFWSLYLYFFFHFLDLLFLHCGFLSIMGNTESYYRVLLYIVFSQRGRVARSDKNPIKNRLKLSGFRKTNIKFLITDTNQKVLLHESWYLTWKNNLKSYQKPIQKTIRKTY